MNIDTDWSSIRRIFESGIASSKHCSIASIDKDGRPHITPIGFIFLRPDQTAFYFEQYTTMLPANFAHCKQICLMTVNSGLRFWITSLLRGQFSSYPGIRLYGEAGQLRDAWPEEIAMLNTRIGKAKYLRGSKLIWTGLTKVRDVRLTSVEPVKYPSMMANLK